MWKINYTFLNNLGVQEEISKEIFELIANESTAYKNV